MNNFTRKLDLQQFYNILHLNVVLLAQDVVEGSIDLDEQRQEVMRELKVVTQCS